MHKESYKGPVGNSEVKPVEGTGDFKGNTELRLLKSIVENQYDFFICDVDSRTDWERGKLRWFDRTSFGFEPTTDDAFRSRLEEGSFPLLPLIPGLTWVVPREKVIYAYGSPLNTAVLGS